MPEQKPDDLAAELVPDPTNIPDLQILRGFLGKSGRPGFSRLYFDLMFTDYVEVADGDILARRSFATDQNPLGGSMLWVKASATLLRATIIPAQEHATFLKGAITASALRRSRTELPVARNLASLGVQRGGPTDPFYYSSCRTCQPGQCGDGIPECCLGPTSTLM